MPTTTNTTKGGSKVSNIEGFARSPLPINDSAEIVVQATGPNTVIGGSLKNYSALARNGFSALPTTKQPGLPRFLLVGVLP